MSSKMDKLKQLKALHKNTSLSLQQIIDYAFEILGNPLVLCDLEYNILAYPEANANSPGYNQYFQNGKVKPAVVEQDVDAGFIEIVMRPDRVVLLENEKDIRICGKIYDTDDLPVAALIVKKEYKFFEEIDFTIVKTICKMLSKEICKIPYYQSYSQKKTEAYITKLINGAMKSEMSTFTLSWIGMIYKGLKESLYAAVADISQCDTTYAKLGDYKDMFKQARPGFKYSVYDPYIVMIISTNESVFYPRKCFRSLNSLFEKDNIKIGISRRFENLFELSRHYNEAVEALKSGLRGDSGQRIFLYDDASASPLDD